MLFWWEVFALWLSFQSAVLLFSCHDQLFLIWIHVTEGDTLLCELSRPQENFACCFMWVYNVVSQITWRTQATEAEKSSWIKRSWFFSFPKTITVIKSSSMWSTWPINRYAYGILGVGDLKECAWKLRCRCEINIKTSLKCNEPAWITFIWFRIGTSGWLLHITCHKMRGISSLAENPLASQDGLHSILAQLTAGFSWP